MERGTKQRRVIDDDSDDHVDDVLWLQQGLAYAFGLHQAHIDLSKAEEYFLQGAEAGDPDATASLGRLYYYNLNRPADGARYLAAAAAGRSQLGLALCLLEGIDRARDEIAAMEWLKKAAEQDLVDAQYLVGQGYEHGRGVAPNAGHATMWYSRATERGHAEALCHLASCHERGRGVPRDCERATSLFLAAAEQGLAVGQYEIGMRYACGSGGLAQDHEKAAEWFHRAAAQGHASAQYRLGVCFETGRGVELDMQLSKTWYAKAAELGHGDAQVCVALRSEAAPEQRLLLDELPSEVLWVLMERFDGRSLVRFAATCRRLHSLATVWADKMVHDKLGFLRNIGDDLWDQATALLRYGLR